MNEALYNNWFKYIDDDLWHHIVITKDDEGEKLYIDGKLVAVRGEE